MTTKSIFRTLSVIDVGKYTKKKGKLTYLSWSWAWAELMKHFPEAYRTVYEHPQTGLPYFTDTTGVMVKVGVTIGELSIFMLARNYQNCQMDRCSPIIPVGKLTELDSALRSIALA